MQLDYTTVLNIAFLLLAAALVWRFLHTGGGGAGHDGDEPDDMEMSHEQMSGMGA